MKKLLMLAAITCTIGLTGCVNASPIDFLVPVKRPSPATVEYLGHMCPTNNANRMYYSLSDAKMAKLLIPPRKMELEGLYLAAKGELDVINTLGEATSNMAWGGITALLAACGIMVPRPQEKHKVEAALYKDRPTVVGDK